jgi:protein-disulfide isomerase
LAKTRKRIKTKKQSQATISPVLIGIVVVASILVVVGLILLGNQTTSVDLSQFPTRGDANAPVTMVEYSDYG